MRLSGCSFKDNYSCLILDRLTVWSCDRGALKLFNNPHLTLWIDTSELLWINNYWQITAYPFRFYTLPCGSVHKIAYDLHVMYVHTSNDLLGRNVTERATEDQYWKRRVFLFWFNKSGYIYIGTQPLCTISDTQNYTKSTNFVHFLIGIFVQRICCSFDWRYFWFEWE